MIQFNATTITIPVFRVGVPAVDLPAQIEAARLALGAQRR
jgi:hypothetical protein